MIEPRKQSVQITKISKNLRISYQLVTHKIRRETKLKILPPSSSYKDKQKWWQEWFQQLCLKLDLLFQHISHNNRHNNFLKCFVISFGEQCQWLKKQQTNIPKRCSSSPERVTSRGKNAGCIAKLELTSGYLNDLIMLKKTKPVKNICRKSFNSFSQFILSFLVKQGKNHFFIIY